MQWLLKNWFKLGLLIVIPLSVGIFTAINNHQVKMSLSDASNAKLIKRAEFTTKTNQNLLTTTPEKYPTNAMCTLKVSASTKLSDQKFAIEAGIDETPMTLTFTDLNTTKPSMIGNMGDKTPLTKIDDGNLIYLIESTSFGNMNVFTLFKDKSVMILSKQYDLIGTPFGLLMMGDCQISSN